MIFLLIILNKCHIKETVIMENYNIGKNDMLSIYIFKRNPNPFDWYQNWKTLKDIITQYVKKHNIILNVGCGNSSTQLLQAMSYQMFKQGYQNIINIDFSAIVIQDMQLKQKGYQESLKYLQMDVRQLQFEDETFDCVLDKGTLDSVLCGSFSGQNSKKMFKQIYRVLKSKGYYICVSYGDPQIRNFQIPQCNWLILKPYKIYKPNITLQNVQFSEQPQKNKDFYHYVYVIQKHALIPNQLQRRISGSQYI